MQTGAQRPTRHGRILILSTATPGQDAEYRRWYDEDHIPEIMSHHPAVRSVERFDLETGSVHGDAGPSGGPARALAVYSVDGDPRDVWEAIRTGPPLGRSAAIDYTSMTVAFVDD